MSNEFRWLNADERNRILAQVQANTEAMNHLNEACHTAVVRGIEDKMYLVINTRKGFKIVELLNAALMDDNTWENNVACGLVAIEPLLHFLTKMVEEPEENWAIEDKRYLAYMAEAAMEIDAMVELYLFNNLLDAALKSLNGDQKPKIQ